MGKSLLFATFKQNFSTNVGQKFKVLVVGGGTGGASISNALGRKLGMKNVAVVEPQDLHYYQGTWTLIGAGLKKYEQCCKPAKNVLIDSTWIKDKVVKFEPEANSVKLGNGKTINYDVLIVAVGFKLSYEKIKGLPEAFNTEGVCSTYHSEYVKKTFSAMQTLQSGNAIFTMPDTIIKCPGAPQKIMYLTEEYFRKTGKRDKTQIYFCTPKNFMFGVKHYNPALEKICDNRQINRLYYHNLIEVDWKNRQAHFEIRDGEGNSIGRKVLEYSMLHIAPPCSAPEVLAENKLLIDKDGFLDVDQYTLQHKTFKNIFGLGDCANVPTSRTAAAAAVESGVLQKNIVDFLEKKSFSASFNGYASCPLITGSKTVIMPEFDYSMTPLETFWFDQSKESRLLYHLKADLFPTVYWKGVVTGKFHGPARTRKLFHPFGGR